ncbi:hypothetical protein DSECCO2_646670 [anaerobic digester metagenome]
MRNNTYGHHNTALGHLSMIANSSGSYNIAIGDQALYSNLTGEYNTAIGNNASWTLSNGSRNTALGYSALYMNLSGGYNTAVGQYSSYYSTSSYNTSLGYSAGDFHPTSYGTFVGAMAYPDADGYTNCTAIGYNARATASNRVVIGNSSVTSIGGFAGWSNFSDGRYKKNVRENVPGIEFVKLLRPVTYTLNVTSLNDYLDYRTSLDLREDELPSLPSAEDLKAVQEKETIVYTGFIAQEVEDAALSIGYNFSGIDAPKSQGGLYNLRYGEFIPPIVKAFQEQQQIIEAQQQQIDQLIRRIEMLESR